MKNKFYSDVEFNGSVEIAGGGRLGQTVQPIIVVLR